MSAFNSLSASSFASRRALASISLSRSTSSTSSHRRRAWSLSSSPPFPPPASSSWACSSLSWSRRASLSLTTDSSTPRTGEPGPPMILSIFFCRPSATWAATVANSGLKTGNAHAACSGAPFPPPPPPAPIALPPSVLRLAARKGSLLSMRVMCCWNTCSPTRLSMMPMMLLSSSESSANWRQEARTREAQPRTCSATRSGILSLPGVDPNSPTSHITWEGSEDMAWAAEGQLCSQMAKS
mmetsp:Transcript_6691/g.15617  ORF Transcript_6691/g.15617 Transcript_6691/m.15617 type:complete len:240 (+) Transcript_6691:100-819(+)